MSSLFETYNVDFQVKRNVITSSTATGSQTIIGTYKGLFRPITDINQMINITDQGREFKLFCDQTVNIQTGDLISINSEDYGISGVSFYEDLDGYDSHLEIRIYQV